MCFDVNCVNISMSNACHNGEAQAKCDLSMVRWLRAPIRMRVTFDSQVFYRFL